MSTSIAPPPQPRRASGSPPAPDRERRPSPDTLAAAHARFARAALAIYLATAAISVVLLIVALVTDKAYTEEQLRERLLLETDVRAHSLAQRLGSLVEELRRLSQRSEVDLRDQDLAPEKSLLQLSHERSAFFNVGVAILDRRGDVVWSEPAAFLARGVSFRNERWFRRLTWSGSLRIVPVQPDRPDSVLYVVSPLVKGPDFTGALLGAVDLARGESLAPGAPASKTLTIVATQDGQVVYPPIPPSFASQPAWRNLFKMPTFDSHTGSANLEGSPSILATSPVAGTELLLMSVAPQDELFREARSRLHTRLVAGLSLALSPAVLLVLFLQRSLKLFRRSEEAAVREERLRLLGEAANAIAHEVKNALNGLSMGLDLVVRVTNPSGAKDGRSPIAPERRERIVGELRREIQRLSEFTTELMTFSRGVEPRRTKLNLTDFVPEVVGLVLESAEELGAELDLVKPNEPVYVEADGVLLHAVISNLAANALDAATAVAHTPRVEVRIEALGRKARVRVSDNGRGVSSTMRPRLFEPFQSEKANGVGIGLALARKIARAHGGDLVLDETARRKDAQNVYPGASFVLTLPLSQAEAEDS